MGFFKRTRISENKSFESSKSILPPPPQIAGKDADFGSHSMTKVFYQKNNNGQFDWGDNPPKQLTKKAAKANDRVAIKIYKVFDNEQPTINGITPMKVHEIELQSALLIGALKDVLKDESIFLEATEVAKFKAPFKPLFFSYDNIVSLYKKSTQGPLKQHLGLLVQVMHDLFDPIFAKLKNFKASGLITYGLAWTFFPRDSLIYSAASDCDRVLKVIDTAYVKDVDERLEIDAKEIAFDGERFAWRTVKVSIPPFQGNRPVATLSNYPLEFHASRAELKARVIERAKKVLQYQGLEYREYKGLGVMTKSCIMEKHNVTGRILVDFYGYQKQHQGLNRTEVKIDHNERARLQLALMDENNQSMPMPPVPNSGHVPNISAANYTRRLSLEEQQENIAQMLAREHDLIFVSPILTGFALKNKLWLKFYVDDIRPVNWNDTAYTHLVYPETQKDLVLTFVSSHEALKSSATDDVIQGKGQGLILLLSGPPGTGKTLTAEAVADKTRRPLYYLQAEDLGTNAAVLGPKIKKVFEMAKEWNAVILLDEADVFMAKREPADIARNELVSIFLRELEYFKGTIFLTTNLYDTVDTAFRSRVNIHLKFESLPASARKLLWEKFLSRALPISDGGTTQLEEEILTELARWELNGREIKNAVKTVRTWCVCKAFEEMTLEHLEAGIKVTAPQALKNMIEKV